MFEEKIRKMVPRFYEDFYITYFLHLRNTINAYAFILDLFSILSFSVGFCPLQHSNKYTPFSPKGTSIDKDAIPWVDLKRWSQVYQLNVIAIARYL